MYASARDAELQAVAVKWAAAEARGDIDGLGSLLSGDFVGIGPHGFTLTRRQWLARYSEGELVHESFGLREVSVRGYDAAGVLTGVQEQESTYGGRRVDGRFRATLFVVGQDERWQIAAIQLSNLADDAERR